MSEKLDFQPGKLTTYGHCVAGRLVRLRFRERKGGRIRHANVIYPWTWTKGNVLASAREAHPSDTVVISEWHPYSAVGHTFEPDYWIANPRKILEHSKTGKPND